MDSILVLTLLLAGAKADSYNGLGQTPQMGWNNWNSFACDVSASMLETAASKIKSFGLQAAGYEYVILDDCWSNGRDSNGNLQPDTTKFPDGITPIADSLHQQGFKFGMYSSAGTQTCGYYEGSLGHEQADANSFASWGVDYLKYDNCNNEGQSGTQELSYKRYKTMSDALLATGRDIFYSMCNWGEDQPWLWADKIANSWRMSGDIGATFDTVSPDCPCQQTICTEFGGACSVLNILNKVVNITQYGGPGHWNDLDMLEVGVDRPGMSDTEEKFHFSMWCLTKSSLIMGNDMSKLNGTSYSILSHAPLIAISQDPAGIPASRIWRVETEQKDENGFGFLELWAGPLENGDQVVALVNAAPVPWDFTVWLDDIFQKTDGSGDKTSRKWDIYDLWSSRLDSGTADAIIAGTESWESHVYDATQKSYADGLRDNDPRLFGNKVGTVPAYGGMKVKISAHDVGIFRLRRP